MPRLLLLLVVLIVGLPAGLLAGAFIDRIGARTVILAGVGFTGASLLLMGSMTRFWHYELLCVMEITAGFVEMVKSPPDPPVLAFKAKSSTMNDVCRLPFSVPIKYTWIVCPLYELTSNETCE